MASRPVTRAQLHDADTEVASAASSRATDEPALLARIRAGDEAAFDALFRGYYAALSDFANRYLRSSDDATEIVQDIFARIWREHAGWRVDGSVRAYLYGAVRNAALNALRHRRVVDRRSAPWAEAASVAAPSVAAAEDADAGSDRDSVERLLRAAAQLPERCRQVFFLRWEHGLSYAEIARIMGISVNTVGAHIQRAYAYLRDPGGAPPA